MHTDKIKPNLTGRFVQPSPNYQRLRPTLTQEQRKQVVRLREAMKEIFVGPAVEVVPDLADLEARTLAAMAFGSGKTTMWTRLWSDVHFAAFCKH
jgi:hypothetical protein